MWDRHVDAFMEGAFRVTINVTETPEGTFKATWDGPNGQVVEATNTSQAQAHRDCSDKIREGVLKREILLGS